jgi:hypothetical protein
MSSVVTYRNNSLQCFCQIKLDSGERVLISIASAPTPSIKVLKLVLGGLIPIQTVWEFNPTMAGGYYHYVNRLISMFASEDNPTKHPLDAIRDVILECKSIDEVRLTLLSLEAAACS